MSNSILVRKTYPFGWDEELGLYFIDTEAHYSTDPDIDEHTDMPVGTVVHTIGDRYYIYAESFDEAYKLINHWIKNKFNGCIKLKVGMDIEFLDRTETIERLNGKIGLVNYKSGRQDLLIQLQESINGNPYNKDLTILSVDWISKSKIKLLVIERWEGELDF